MTFCSSFPTDGANCRRDKNGCYPVVEFFRKNGLLSGLFRFSAGPNKLLQNKSRLRDPLSFGSKGLRRVNQYAGEKRTEWTRERKRSVSESSSLLVQSSNDRSLSLYLTSPFILPESLTLIALLIGSTIFVWSRIFSVHLPLLPVHDPSF